MPGPRITRHAWAVDLLGVQSSDRLLEVGCGTGEAVSLVCERLQDGFILGLDRSAVMIERAERRNQAHVAAGRARFLRAALREADLGGERFDRVFGVNVNVFWTGVRNELDIIRACLKPGGTLHLVYEPPTPGKGRAVEERVARTLTLHGFTAERVILEGAGRTPLVCVVGIPEERALP